MVFGQLVPEEDFKKLFSKNNLQLLLQVLWSLWVLLIEETLEVLRYPGPLIGTFDLGSNLPGPVQHPGGFFTDEILPLEENFSTPASIKKDESHWHIAASYTKIPHITVTLKKIVLFPSVVDTK